MSRPPSSENRENRGRPQVRVPRSPQVHQCVMNEGKMSDAESIFYRALYIVEEKTGQPL